MNSTGIFHRNEHPVEDQQRVSQQNAHNLELSTGRLRTATGKPQTAYMSPRMVACATGLVHLGRSRCLVSLLGRAGYASVQE